MRESNKAKLDKAINFQFLLSCNIIMAPSSNEVL